MSQRQFNLFFLVDVGVTDGLVVEDLESLATVVKISCLKILSHFHGKGGVGWQYKLARLSQNSASQMDNSPNSFYRFRSFKLGEFERFEVALDSAINSTTVVQKLAAAGANNCLSVVKKLNRLLVELISCDWSVINVSSPVKQSRAYGRVSQEVQQQTEERNNFVFIISSSLQLTGDSHSSIIDPATMANLCDQYKVATFVLDISSYLNVS